MASRPYLLKENSMSFLWRNDLRLKTFLFMALFNAFFLDGRTASFAYCSYGMMPHWENFAFVKDYPFGSAVPLGSALLWCCSFCKRSPFWKYCSFERVISFLEGSSLWEDYFLVIPFSLMKASRASPPSMLLIQSVRMLTFSGATTFSTFSVLALTQ